MRTLGKVTIDGTLLGGEGFGSGAVISGGTIDAIKLGARLTTGAAIQGGSGAVSGTIFAHGSITNIYMLKGVAGGSGAGSGSIQAEGTIGQVFIAGDLAGGTGVESGSIFSHENASAARPIAGNIGTVTITGSLIGAAERSALIEADGALGRAFVFSMLGGTGADSASIITGAGLLPTGRTASISVSGIMEAGLTHQGAEIRIG